MYVNSPTGLELAAKFDAPDEEWTQLISFADLVTDDTPLKPATWSDAQKTFLTSSYGLDGRLTDKWQVLGMKKSADAPMPTDSKGYYVVGTFFARTHETCTVSLAEAAEINDGKNGYGTYVIGTPVWDADKLIHVDGGSGAETAIRLGFMITPINSETGEDAEGSTFYIYEPNCDVHREGDDQTYKPTPSIDGTETLSKNLILQTVSGWSEADPVQRLVTIKDLGKFTTSTELFRLYGGNMLRIDLYVWLEGQDIDCTNTIKEARIMANIQFNAKYDNQSGLVDIPQ
ncbi:MAG: hypothetical protein IJT91_05935 [Clostridia bacterium]|nr:hypothetical protein [Clostridia bacterium]